MNKWEMVKLGTIGDFKSGGTPTRTKTEYFNGKIPWVTTTSLGNIFIDDNDAVEHISEEAVEYSATKIISENSIMVGIRIGIGKVSINKVPMCASQDIISIENIDEQEIYKPYIVHCIKSNNQYFDKQKRGATIQGINSAVLKSLQVPLPPLKIQNQIAKTLDTAAELLAMRKQQLAELGNMIKSIFYDMFGDPVANEKGWSQCYINDVYNIIDGDRGINYPKQDDFEDKGYCLFLNTGNVTKNGFNFDHVKFISEEKDKQLRKGKVQRDDIILTTRGTVGNIVHYDDTIPYEVVRINSGMVLLRRKNINVSPVFFCEMFKSDEMKREVKYFLSGTAQPQLPITNLTKITIVLPPIQLQTKFAEIVNKIEDQKALVQKAIDKTQHLFHSLMSEYFE